MTTPILLRTGAYEGDVVEEISGVTRRVAFPCSLGDATVTAVVITIWNKSWVKISVSVMNNNNNNNNTNNNNNNSNHNNNRSSITINLVKCVQCIFLRFVS